MASLALRTSSTEISILVCGATGVGKSTLIDFILGEDACEISFPQNSDREAIPTVVQKPTVTIYESSDSSVGELYIKCEEVDLIIYCQRMTQVRLDQPPPETVTFLRALTEGGFLKKTVLVLTKANLVEPFRMDEDVIEYFRDVYSVMMTMIRSEVAKANREDSLGATLSAVPVGSARYPTLPDGKHFMGYLYVSCLECLPQEKRKEFIQATNLAKRLIMSYRYPSPRESLAEHIQTMSLSEGEKPPPYPVYMDEEDSEHLRSLGIRVCKFRYAGCKKVLPHKEMTDHMKSFRDSTAHIEILAEQLESLYQQYQKLHQQFTELHEQIRS